MHNGNKIIDEKQLIKNIKELKKCVGNKKICAMVKADAYGHGLENIAELIKDKVDFFGVSNINEALLLRKKFPDNKILIVGKTFSFEDCIKNDISFIIDSYEHFKLLINFYHNNFDANNFIPCINIHIKINSGMNRLGINSIEDFKKIYKIAKSNNINIEGISTHFATADCDRFLLKKQVDEFIKYIREIPKDENPIINLGGSGVLLKSNESILEKFQFDMIRVGIAMYGYCAKEISEKIMPILRIESKIIKIIDVKKGDYVGYSKGFRAEEDLKIGIVPLGYGDGIPRNLSNKISIQIISKDEFLKKHINKCAVVGNICMDMLFVDLTKSNFVKELDKVIVVKNVKKWADILQTIPYEILTGFSQLR